MRGANYRWPQSLRKPSNKAIYLDLNHWIALAKAMSGHPEGEAHLEVLETCINAVDGGLAVFPLTSITYMELFKIGRYRQRSDLCKVIERISQFAVAIPLTLIRTHEIEAMLDGLVGPSPNPAITMDYLDRGVSRAFGFDGRLRIYREELDIAEEFRSNFRAGQQAFDDLVRNAELDMNRKVILGPEENEIPKLEESGWDPRASLEVQNRRAQQELDQVGRFNIDPKWRRGRIRDVISAREIFIELNENLTRSLNARQSEIEDILGGPSENRRALDVMPSFDVSVSLKTSYHRDPNHKWTTNDIHDIDAMASTLPYCDIVVTDGEVKSHIDRNDLGKRLDTVVLSSLSELSQHLS